ncbi:MAG: hypothetical protein ABIZ64_11375 [Casimicrobium sp.]
MPQFARSRLSKHFALALLASAALAGCVATPVATRTSAVPPPSYATGYFERSPCGDRIGRCFDATIGGKAVSVIAEKAEFEALRAQLAALNRNVRDVYWRVLEPVDGKLALNIITTPNAAGAELVGTAKEEADVTVYALDDQDLKSKTEQVARNDVRVSGQPIVVQQETLTQNFLPPGRYAFAIKHIGRKNWDRKWVFLTVK